MDAAAKTIQIRRSVHEMIAYFSLFDVPVSMDRLVTLLPIKANHLAVLEAVRELITAKHIVRIGDEYGLKRHDYGDRKEQLKLQAELLQRAQDIGGLIGAIPFVKAVVVVSSVAVGDVSSSSDIDLVVVTTPGRIFLAQKFISWLLRLDRARQGERGRIDITMFLTIRGVALERDIMRTPEPHLRYWLLTALPVYGEKRWAEILQGSPYLRDKTPNVLWPRGARTIDRWSWRPLDSWDDRRYRRFLKKNSQDAASQGPRSFSRIRPDIVNIHVDDKSTEIAQAWEKIRSKIGT